MSDPLVSIGIVTNNSAWCPPKVLDRIRGPDYPKKQIQLVYGLGMIRENVARAVRPTRS